jgi:uncharacterized protein
MIVVSDTSCVSNLITIGRVELLNQLFGEVIIPPEVHVELSRHHPTLPSFVKLVSPRDTATVSRLSSELDLGEAEAISLARELRADRLLIDEKNGRAVALREGVPIIDVVGILITAKQQGLLTSVRAVLDALDKEAGFRLSRGVRADALRAVGEE